MCEFKKRAVEVSFDLSKQFISLAFAGVAFAVGLSAGSSKVSDSGLFWVVIGLFSLSALLGFLYLMRATASLSDGKEFDIYEFTSRLFATLQIVLVFVGIGLLLMLHLKYNQKNASDSEGVSIEITANQNKLNYKVADGKDVKIFLDKDGKINFQATATATLTVSNAPNLKSSSKKSDP